MLSLSYTQCIHKSPTFSMEKFTDYRYGANFKIQMPTIKRHLITFVRYRFFFFISYLIDFIFVHNEVLRLGTCHTTWRRLTYCCDFLVVEIHRLFTEQFRVKHIFFIITIVNSITKLTTFALLFLSLSLSSDCCQTSRLKVDCYISYNGCYEILCILWKCTDILNTGTNLSSWCNVQ